MTVTSAQHVTGHIFAAENIGLFVAATVCWLPTDINACLRWTCTRGDPAGNITCTDILASDGGLNNTDGRNCTCLPGYEYSPDKGCTSK
jgi:hypothetical protein